MTYPRASGYEAVVHELWERAPTLPAGGTSEDVVRLLADSMKFIGHRPLDEGEQDDLRKVAAEVLHLDNKGEQLWRQQ